MDIADFVQTPKDLFKNQENLKKYTERTCFTLNWPKLAWCKDKWNVYTMYAVQLICTNFFLVIICLIFIWRNVLLIYLINLLYTGITKKLTNVEIQEQTASLTKKNSREMYSNAQRFWTFTQKILSQTQICCMSDIIQRLIFLPLSNGDVNTTFH